MERTGFPVISKTKREFEDRSGRRKARLEKGKKPRAARRRIIRERWRKNSRGGQKAMSANGAG